MGFEFGSELHQNGEVGTDRLALPFIDYGNDFTLLPFQVKRLIAVLWVMINQDRLFNPNAIANFHMLLYTLLTRPMPYRQSMI